MVSYGNRIDLKDKNIILAGNIRGNRIIDIGCGPSICGLIPAAKWFEGLYLAEYSKNNRDELRKWLERETGAHNWEPFFRYFATDDCNGYVCHHNKSKKLNAKTKNRS